MLRSSCFKRLRLEEAGGDCHLFGVGDFDGDLSLGDGESRPGDEVLLFLLLLFREISLGNRISLLATLTRFVTTPFTKTSRKSPFCTPLLLRPSTRPFLFFIFCMDFWIRLQTVSFGRSML